jgi:hypothetical protein
VLDPKHGFQDGRCAGDNHVQLCFTTKATEMEAITASVITKKK